MLLVTALRVEVRTTIGKQSYLLSGPCGGVVSGFIVLLGPHYSREFVRHKLEGVKRSLIVLRFYVT